MPGQGYHRYHLRVPPAPPADALASVAADDSTADLAAAVLAITRELLQLRARLRRVEREEHRP